MSDLIEIGAPIYVTKYGLNKGIEMSRVVGSYESEATGQTRVSLSAWGRYTYFTVGVECFLTSEEAFADVENRRLKAIKSLSKKLSKLGTYIPKVVEVPDKD